MDLDYTIYRQMVEEKAEYCSAKSLEFLVSLHIHDRTYRSSYYLYGNNPINIIGDNMIKSTNSGCFNATETKMIADLEMHWDSPMYDKIRSIFFSKLNDGDRKKYQHFSQKDN